MVREGAGDVFAQNAAGIQSIHSTLCRLAQRLQLSGQGEPAGYRACF